jgi:hypothetical protein
LYLKILNSRIILLWTIHEFDNLIIRTITTTTTTITTFIIIIVVVVVIIIIIIIIIIGSTALFGPWPSPDFASNNFYRLYCQHYTNPQQAWTIHGFLSGCSSLADKFQI